MYTVSDEVESGRSGKQVEAMQRRRRTVTMNEEKKKMKRWRRRGE